MHSLHYNLHWQYILMHFAALFHFCSPSVCLYIHCTTLHQSHYIQCTTLTTNLRAQLCTTDTTNFWILTNKDLRQVLDASQAWKWQPKTLKLNPNVHSFAQSSPATQCAPGFVWYGATITRQRNISSIHMCPVLLKVHVSNSRVEKILLYFFVRQGISMRDKKSFYLSSLFQYAF